MGDLSIDKSRLSLTETGIRSNLVSAPAAVCFFCAQPIKNSGINANTTIDNFGFKKIAIVFKAIGE